MSDASETRTMTGEPVDRVEATVFACVLEFELVLVRTAEGYEYALTPDTPGVSLGELREGRRVECVVTRRLPRVLAAKLLD